tara:strand:+ start:540 stop:974 length:435 start_codon:yes stop_codon:yes gene_type:complete
MQPGQQFSDWNSIDSSGNGILPVLAAYGIEQTGLADYLNAKMPEGMVYKDGKLSYAKPSVAGVVPPMQQPIANGIAPTMGANPVGIPPQQAPGQGMVTPSQAPIQQEVDHDKLGSQMLNLSSWNDETNGTSAVDKVKMLTSLFG